MRVNIVDGRRVEVDGVEPVLRPVQNLQTRVLLHRQIDDQRQVRQLTERLQTASPIQRWSHNASISASYLERHELVVGFRRPGVNFDRRFEPDDEELDSLVANNFEVHGTLQITYVHPSVSLLRLKWAQRGERDCLLVSTLISACIIRYSSILLVLSLPVNLMRTGKKHTPSVRRIFCLSQDR